MPNLSELGLSPGKPVVERSVSENEAERENYRKLQLKMERRIKNREKLMAMKRYSGFLKRPEILGSWIFRSSQETKIPICLQRQSIVWRRRNQNKNPRRRMMKSQPTLEMVLRGVRRAMENPQSQMSPQ